MSNQVQVERLKQLYCDDGLSLRKTGKELGISKTCVRYKLRQAGIEPRSRNIQRSVPGRIITSTGYTKLLDKDHPRADRDGYVLEHILVWEEIHNRPLPKGWVIHHLNGIRTDNSPQNLRALPTSKHDILIPTLKQRIRELEIENKQLRRALENSQMLFYVGEN